MSHLGFERQFQIFASGTPPTLPLAFEAWEARARDVLPPAAFGYVAGGAGSEDTARENRQAFERWRVRPRVLRDVSDRDLSTTIGATRFVAPIFLGPVGVLSIVHPDAELAVARAASTLGLPFILSTVSSFTIEQVAAVGDGPRWFQLYPGRDRSVMASLIRRAEAAGYTALVVTVDAPMLGWRVRDLHNAYLPFLQGQGIANYLSDPAFRAGLARPPEDDPRAAIQHFLNVFVNPSFTWTDVAALREMTRLPLLIKGITHPDDARLALENGSDGLIVSNHGGRQVDGAVAALDALPEIADAVGEKMPVLFDSGIRDGADILKALALGARAVLLGRPYVYGLAVGGDVGVVEVTRNLLADFDLELALSGFRAVRELDRAAITASCRKGDPER